MVLSLQSTGLKSEHCKLKMEHLRQDRFHELRLRNPDGKHRCYFQQSLFSCDAELEIDDGNFREPERHHQFKPLPIKLPSLVLFFCLFGVCIACIERLLAMTITQNEISNTPSALHKRQSEGYDAIDYVSQSSNMIAPSESMYSEYGSLYEPSSTTLSPVLQTLYDLWKQHFDSLLHSQSSIQQCTSWEVWAKSDPLKSTFTVSTSTKILSTQATLTATRIALVYDKVPNTSFIPSSKPQVAYGTEKPSYPRWTPKPDGASLGVSTPIAVAAASRAIPVDAINHPAESSFLNLISLHERGPTSELLRLLQPTMCQDMSCSTSLTSITFIQNVVEENSTTEPVVQTPSSTDAPAIISQPQEVSLSSRRLSAATILAEPTLFTFDTRVVVSSYTKLSNSSTKQLLRRYADNSSSNLTKPSQVPGLTWVNATTLIHTSTQKFVTTTRFTTFIQTTAANGQSTSFSAIAIKNVTLDSSPTVSSDGSVETDLIHDRMEPNPRFVLSSGEAIIRGNFTMESYFYARFAAPIIAIGIKAFSEAVVASFKLVEPFHCLSRKPGVDPVQSLSAQYLSSSISLDVFRSLRHGHLVAIWSTSMFVLLAVATPLVAASMSVRVQGICIIDGIRYRCDPAWVVNTKTLRYVEGILATCMLLVLLLILSTVRYSIDLACNPSSIAAVLGLLNDKTFVKVLQRFDPEITNATLTYALEPYKFRLSEHEDLETSQKRFGITTVETPSPIQRCDYGWMPKKSLIGCAIQNSSALASPMPLLAASSSKSLFAEKVHMNNKTLTNISDTLHLLTALTLFSLVAAYYFNARPDIFNPFFNSQSSGLKIILTMLATVIDMEMKNLERVVRIKEPYRRLSLRNGRPETTILMPLNGTCWSNLPQCLWSLQYRHGHMLWQTIVSVVAALSDFNIIAAAGVPYTVFTTKETYLMSVYVSLIITGLIIAVVLTTMLWWRRVPAIHDMPRQPSTIGAVCMYLCGSKIVEQWSMKRSLGGVRLEELKDEQLNEVIIEAGCSFWFGRTLGVDGKARWNIDFEKESYE